MLLILVFWFDIDKDVYYISILLLFWSFKSILLKLFIFKFHIDEFLFFKEIGVTVIDKELNVLILVYFYFLNFCYVCCLYII